MKPKKPTLNSDLKLVDTLQPYLVDEGVISNISSTNQNINNIKAKTVTVKRSKLCKIQTIDVDLRNLCLDDVLLTSSDLSAIKLPCLSAERVEIRDTRLSGIQIYDATLRELLFRECKLDLSNFRFSKLKNVVFENCVLVEADFAGAIFDNVCFKNCELEKADFSNAEVKKLDLRTSNIIGINGISSLKGAIISPTQLITMVPQLANEIGLITQD
jgi:uncharacterized protein YjbI with pentapeptide repeats